MIRVFFLFLIIIFSISVSTQAFGEKPKDEVKKTQEGVPKLVLESQTFDFGEVEEGTPVEHEFAISNDGSAPLLITDVNPDCGCTAAVAESPTILPGEETVINVSFDTIGFYGEKNKTIRLHTTDPKKPTVLLTLKGKIRREVEVIPPRFYFGSIQKGTQNKMQGKVSLRSESKTKIIDIISRSEHVEIERGEIEKGAGEKFTIVLKDDVPAGVFRDRIVVKTNNKKQPVINVPVFAQIQGDLVLIPADVSFGLLDGPLEEQITGSVMLKNKGPHKLEIESIEAKNESLSASFERNDKTGDYLITVSVRPGTVGTIKGRLKINTNHPDPDQKQVTLPVYGIITKKNT